MRVQLKIVSAIFAGCFALIFIGLLPSGAQTSAPLGLSQARQIVESRKALFLLIGAYFRPLGAVLKGEKPYDPQETPKRIERIAYLSQLLDETFPEGSNIGLPDSKGKAEIWSNHDDFLKKLKALQTSAIALQKIDAADKNATDSFKTALATLAQSCKSCHDVYKEK